MLKISKSTNFSYNAIFQSAFKALVVFELILEAPKTLNQIAEYFNKIPYVKRVSKDSIRAYINSFQASGCEVEIKLNKGQKREYTYHITSSPFSPQISNNLAKRIFDIYDVIMYNKSFIELLHVDNFINKLNENSKNPFFDELYTKHSVIRKFDKNLLLELQRCCEENLLVTVLYKSPQSGEKEIPIIAHNMKIQNYKLYLEGFGLEYNQEAIFLLDRIIKIINVVPSDNINCPQDNFFEIIFELYDSNIELLPQEELLSEANGIRLVKHKTDNKVLTMHRFLQLEAAAKILSPDSFIEEFIAKLKSAKEVYAHG